MGPFSGLRAVKGPALLWNTEHGTLCQKQQDILLLTITMPNVDRFSKFFHRRTQ